ncbi:MAG: trigger factor [Chloroflexi bacterium]|nr:trigger factor [Chloroflexota bacterium]
MHITKEEVVDRQIALRIELEEDDLEPYLERGYRKVVNKVSIPGFRKGKAPRQIVQQYYGKEGLLNDIWDHLAQDVTNKAIDSEKLDASGLPKIELLDLSPVVVKAIVPLTPEVELGDYKSIRVPLESVEVTDEQLNERIEAIRSSTATWEPVERSPKMGDLVSTNILCTVEGQKWIEQEDAVLVLDKESDRPLPGFSESIEGAEIGKAKEFLLAFPEDYPEAKFAGKEGQFTVTVTEVKEEKMPELDDEFAKSVGESYESLDALKTSVREELQKEAEGNRDNEHREQILKALIDGSKFEIPPLLLEHEADHVLSDREQTLARMNVRLDDYVRYSGTTIEKLKEDAKEAAADRLKRAFAMREFAEAEKLEVPEEDIEERLKLAREHAEETRAQQKAAGNKGGHSHDDEDLDSPQTRESIKRAILMDKALEHLADMAQNEIEATEARPKTEKKATKASAEIETIEEPETEEPSQDS